jgi:hypothetical protein
MQSPLRRLGPSLPAPPAGRSVRWITARSAFGIVLAGYETVFGAAVGGDACHIGPGHNIARKPKIAEAHRLLSLLQGMIEGALAEVQHGRWWR